MEMEVSPDSKGRIDGPLSSASRMKKSETKDSMSSVDSDVSLSFDGRSSRSDEADSSDYDSEVRFPERIDIDRDSGADSSNEPKLADVSSDGSPRMESAVSTVSTVERTTTNDELAERICAQVEYYFSDENIAKDAFLLKHVRRNKEGYVSLKLISSFKKVKHLSRDWRVVGAALSRSNKLEVNSQGTKLRRVNPLPSFDQTAPSRTVVAAGLPTERLTVESVAEIFKPCGEIALIRVLKSGRPIPPEVNRKSPSERGPIFFLFFPHFSKCAPQRDIRPVDFFHPDASSNVDSTDVVYIPIIRNILTLIALNNYARFHFRKRDLSF